MGVVEVGSRLTDAGVRVEITVPCIVHLTTARR